MSDASLAATLVSFWSRLCNIDSQTAAINCVHLSLPDMLHLLLQLQGSVRTF